MKNTKVYYWTPALAALLTLASCHQDPAQLVQQRAVERWNLLINQQPVKAYDYLSPGYRETHSLDQYVAFISTARLRWKSAKVEKQECDAEVCTLHLTIAATIPGNLANLPKDIEHEAPVTERWIASDGQWYFLPDANLTGKESPPMAKESDAPADKK